jgi:predicted MPP superfamily phosphohydrolase
MRRLPKTMSFYWRHKFLLASVLLYLVLHPSPDVRPLLPLLLGACLFVLYVVSQPYAMSPHVLATSPELIGLINLFVFTFLVLSNTLSDPVDDPDSWVAFAWAIRRSAPYPLFYTFFIFPLTAISHKTISAAAQASKPIVVFWALFMSCVFSLLIAFLINFFLFDLAAALVVYVSSHYEFRWLFSWVFWFAVPLFLVLIFTLLFCLVIMLPRAFVPLLRTLFTFGWLVKAYFSKWRLISSYKTTCEYCGVSDQSASVTRLLLVSDLHVSAPGHQVLESDRSSEATLAKLAALVQSRRPDALVILGDITDTGHEEAWERVRSCISSLNTSVFAIPGNHDYNFKSFNEWSLLFEAYPAYEVGRHIASLLDCLSIQSADGSAPTLKSLTKTTVTKKLEPIYFPRLDRVGTTNVLLVSFDSNRRSSTNPMTNAVGYVGSDQMEKAESLIKSNRKESDFLILLVHHHVLLPYGSVRDQYLQCLDAHEVLTFAERNNVNLVAHGHIHLPLMVQYNRRDGGGVMPILSCGSLHHPPRWGRNHPSMGARTTEASAYAVSVFANGGVTTSIV